MHLCSSTSSMMMTGWFPALPLCHTALMVLTRPSSTLLCHVGPGRFEQLFPCNEIICLFLALPRWLESLASGLVLQKTCHRPAPPHTLTWDNLLEVLHQSGMCGASNTLSINCNRCKSCVFNTNQSFLQVLGCMKARS